MTIRVLVSAAGIILLLANPGWAQSTTSSTTTTIGSFDSLSPGNQKIANALFSAQKTTGTTPLTKNQIADLKGTEGWGKVFKTLKADGLVSARNLGQVVSSYQHSLRSSTTSTARSGTTTTTTTATRSGRTTASASSRTGSSFRSAGMTNGRGFSGGSPAMGGFGMGGGGFSHGGGGFGGGGFGGGGGHGR